MALGENVVLTTSFATSADLSALQYAPITLSGASLAGSAAAAASAVGILQNKPDGSTPAGIQTASVMVNGISRVVASAAITIGDKIGCAGSGEVRTAVSGDHVIGVALEAAAGANAIISMLVTIGGAPLP